MSNSHFSRISLDACYLMLFATLWRKEVVEGFYSVFWQGWKGYRKRMCDELRQMARRQAVWQWREERRRGQSGVGGLGGGVCVKKCRVEGFGRAESALMQTLWGANHTLTHTHTHTCTQASNEFCCSTVRYIFHIRMSYWAEAALGTATPCCTVRLLHGLTELD